jgi:hypothetical protein
VGKFAPSDDGPARDGDELLGPEQLIAEGLSSDDARAVLGPHAALPRWEVRDRHEMLMHERDGYL